MGESVPPVDPSALRTRAAVLLGPAAESLLTTARGAALALARMRAGSDLDDAVLGLAHAQATEHPELASEFAGWLMLEMHRAGRGLAGPALRRFLDTGDLVQSVAGDLWPELFELEFETRGQFLALLASRMRWKATDHARAQNAARRREDLRVEPQAEDLDHARSAPSPLTEAGQREELEQLALALGRLPERDARMIRRWLAGEDWERIGVEEALAPESARKAVQRAIARARELCARGGAE